MNILAKKVIKNHLNLIDSYLGHGDPKPSNQHSFHPYACPLPWKWHMNILAKKVIKNHLNLIDFQMKSLL